MPPKRSASHEPFWWYGDKAAISSRIITSALWPVSAVYAAVASHRMRRAASYRSQLPVICVGNFTAGGTGKTPLVRALCHHLRATGHTPVILSRGYGGSTRGTHRVDRTTDTATTVGDEPLLLATETPVIIARDRAAGARFIEANQTTLNATHIVMDDGLQNPTLHQDVRIAVVDRRRGIGNGHVIPSGPLRAPFEAQCARTDILVTVTPPNQNPTAPSRAIPDVETIAVSIDMQVAAYGDTSWLKGSRVIAYAGIGAPERFFVMLENLGANLVDCIAFADHHTFSDVDAERLIASSKQNDAQLVTTEKDAVRLDARSKSLAALAAQSRTVPIAAILTPDALAAIDGVISALTRPS